MIVRFFCLSEHAEESDDEDGDLLPAKDLGAALKGRNDFYLRQEREAGNCLECTFGCEFVNQFSLCDSKNGRVYFVYYPLKES